MLLHRLLLISLVGCATTQTTAAAHDDRCQNAGALDETRIDNLMTTMDSLCTNAHMAFACVEWGDAVEHGRCGIPPDRARAQRYYAQACANAYAPACRALERSR
jgi:hypothetical protein